MAQEVQGSTRGLLRTYQQALDALRERGVVRSNKVVADYGEWLATTALGLTLMTSGANKGYDAVHPCTGERYQVKVRQLTAPYYQPDLRGQGDLTARPFDYLVGILLDADYGVVSGAVIPHPVVLARAKPITYNNGWRLHMARGLLGIPEVTDVTTKLRKVGER